MPSAVKSVLITGCSSGLGKEIARVLKNKGWDVYATVRKERDLEILRNEGFSCFLLDLDSSESIKSAVRQLLLVTGGKLDALVNNAGYSQLGAIEDLSRNLLRAQFETNLFGTVELTNLLIPVFRRQRYGRIVCIISSHNNGFAFPFFGAESASKNALIATCNALRQELRDTGISISMVCPGGFHTQVMVHAVQGLRTMMQTLQSNYRATYERLCAFLLPAPAEEHAANPRLVAGLVATLLEEKNPRAIVVVPFSAKLHYLAHRILPVTILDCLTRLKMKIVYKVL